MNLLKSVFLSLFLVCILFSISFFSCTFDNEEDLLENYICDTTDVIYSDLTYIFTGICANCHNSTSTFRDGIIMDSYNNVKSSINTGLVIPAIEHQNGVPPMPNNLPKLSDCDLNKIRAWINSGMPENN